MDCKQCENNYLYKLFQICMNENESIETALMAFDRICANSGDPRNPLTIVSLMNKNECDRCDQYRHYYRDIIKDER